MENDTIKETMTIEAACAATKHFSEAHKDTPDVIEHDELNMEHLCNMKDIKKEVVNEAMRLIPNKEFVIALEDQLEKIKNLCAGPAIGSNGDGCTVFQEMQN